MKEMKNIYLRPTTARPASFKPIPSKGTNFDLDRLKSAGRRIPAVEQEKLYEDCIHLKTSLNFLNRRLMHERSENLKKENELKRQEKVLKEFSETQTTFLPSTGLIKVKETNLVSNLKRQFKAAKQEVLEKEAELEKLKRTLRATKIREAQLEAEAYLEEIKNLKLVIAAVSGKVSSWDKLKKDYSLLQDKCYRQEEMIKLLQEENRIFANGKQATKEIKRTRNASKEKETIKLKKMDEDAIKECACMIAKNFQVKNIGLEELNKCFLSKDNKQISDEEIANNIIAALRVKDLNDKSLIFLFTKSLQNVNELLLHNFTNLSSFTDKEQAELTTKLTSLLPSSEKLHKVFSQSDAKSTGFLPFHEFRQVVNHLNIYFDKETYEFMTSLLTTEECPSIFMLQYTKLIRMKENELRETSPLKALTGKLNSEPQNQKDIHDPSGSLSATTQKVEQKYDSNPKTSNVVSDEGNDEPKKEEINENEEEVVITLEQFNQKVDKILSLLAGHLHSLKTSTRDFFKDMIVPHEVSEDVSYDSISLKEFIGKLQEINITLDTIDIYCIFSKLKFSEEYETVDMAKINEEMANYGIIEENMTTKREQSAEIN